MDIHELRTSKPFISPNSKDNDQPRKMTLNPPSMNNSGTLRKKKSVCPHAGVHRTCLTINGIEPRRTTPHSKSPRSGWRCGLSTTQHQLTVQGASCDVVHRLRLNTMSRLGDMSNGARTKITFAQPVPLCALRLALIRWLVMCP